MGCRLLEDLVVSASSGAAGPRWRAWPVSMAMHALAVSAVIAVVPQVKGQSEPEKVRGPVVFSPGKHPTRGGGGGSPRTAQPRVVRAVRAISSLTVPAEPAAPESVLEETGSTEPSETGIGGLPCISNCGGGGGSGEPGPEDGGGPAQPVRPSEVQRPTKVRDVAPLYPELARRTGVEGVVTIECSIDTEGRVVDARVLGGHPLLRSAALEAVRQWRYTPTRLNGVPVAVIMSVTVQFRLVR